MKVVYNVHIRRAASIAKKLLSDIGLNEVTDLPMKLLISGLGGILIEEPLKGSDGRIIQGKKKAIIKVNSNIKYEARKRFAIAHEIGHLLMHKDIAVHNENTNTLSWFNDAMKKYKSGIQELEANQFATELLMPSDLFNKEARGKQFSPQLLQYLSKRFNTSITSTAFRYMQFHLHPICIVFISNGVVSYWKKSEDLKVWVKEMRKLPPPKDSVAEEYIKADYDFVYKGEEKQQEIDKSIWFKLGNYERQDKPFYEYCIPTKPYKTILSIIWED